MKDRWIDRGMNRWTDDSRQMIDGQIGVDKQMDGWREGERHGEERERKKEQLCDP